jgi:hypothetical protein
MKLKDPRLYPHKEGVDKYEWSYLHTYVVRIAKTFIEFAEENDLEICVTSIYRDDSSSHMDFRAIDFRSRSWPIKKCAEVENLINKKHTDIGAFSASSGATIACLWHDSGRGQHFHLQCRRN